MMYSRVPVAGRQATILCLDGNAVHFCRTSCSPEDRDGQLGVYGFADALVPSGLGGSSWKNEVHAWDHDCLVP